MPSYYSDERGPYGRNLQPSAAVCAAVRNEGLATPNVVSGGIYGFEQAETVLREGCGDIVGFARQALADPDWFRKVRLGRGDDVRRCLFTNYCEGLDQAHKAVTCQLWDRARGLPDDAQAQRPSDGRRLVAPAWES